MDHAKAATGPATPAGLDELILPGVPANVRPGGDYRVEGVTNDVYNIAQRLKELDTPYPLALNVIEDKTTGQVAYTVVELGSNGERVVFRTHRLDARVIEHVQYLVKVPFHERFKKAEELQAKWDAEEHDNEMDELVERLGLPMMRELMALGFDGHYSAGSTSRRRFGAK